MLTSFFNNLWCNVGWSTILFLSFGLSACNLLPPSVNISQAQEEDSQVENLSTEPSSLAQQLPISAQLLINGEQINLEVAQTPEQQQLGLMYRESLPNNRGMLFPFAPPILANFWMKNVSISLDMIFVSDGVVESIAHNVPPCKKDPCPIYRSKGFIDQVIELSGGRAQELKIQSGDRLEIKYLK